MWEIRHVVGKGLGVFATTFIPRGTRIFSEPALISIRQDQTARDIYAASILLDPRRRQELLKLSAYVSKESAVIRWNQAIVSVLKQRMRNAYTRLRRERVSELGKWSIRDHVTINCIFRTNAFRLGSSSLIQQAVFPRISRINHSCIPNSQGNFHEKIGKFNVHSTRDIDADEEITLCYLPQVGATRDVRQRTLMDDFGFECTCPACDMSTERARRGEERRARMQELLDSRRVTAVEGKWYNSDGSEDFYSGSTAEYEKQDPTQELKTIELYIMLFEEENIAGRELSTLYFEAAKLCETLRRPLDALSFAKKGLKIDRDCLGIDHPLYENSLKIVQEIRFIA